MRVKSLQKCMDPPVGNRKLLGSSRGLARSPKRSGAAQGKGALHGLRLSGAPTSSYDQAPVAQNVEFSDISRILAGGHQICLPFLSGGWDVGPHEVAEQWRGSARQVGSISNFRATPVGGRCKCHSPKCMKSNQPINQSINQATQ